MSTTAATTTKTKTKTKTEQSQNQTQSSNVQTLLASLVEMSGQQAQQTREMHRNLKRLVTEVEREQKKLAKSSKPKRTVKQKPVTVSAAMVKFLKGRKVEDQDGGYTRQTMMKAVSAYIKDQKLQLEENKKNWKPDKTLKKLFTLDEKQTYTFMNINGLLSRVVQKKK
tara:strand:- start:252 stop:755 length:504 start_codon:yes stop_codon:yes gene_type:complete